MGIKSVPRQEPGTVMTSTPTKARAMGSKPREYTVVTPKAADQYRKRRSSIVESISGTSKVEGKGDDSLGEDRKPPRGSRHCVRALPPLLTVKILCGTSTASSLRLHPDLMVGQCGRRQII